MTQTERAPAEVAKFFHRKYGHDKAIAIISSRLEAVQHVQDSEFWLNVMQIIDSIEQPACAMQEDLCEQSKHSLATEGQTGNIRS